MSITVINEKGLLKAVSDAAAHGGVKINFNKKDHSTVIQTNEWLVSMLNRKIPRKILGLIAEYLGEIPETGCFLIFKHKSKYEVQTYMLETFKADIRNLAMGKPQNALYTGMQLWGQFIYVSRDGELLGAKPEDLILLESSFVQIIPGKSLKSMDDESTVYIKLFDSMMLPPIKQTIWGSLTSIDWWEEKASETRSHPEDDELQMKLAERDESEEDLAYESRS